MVCGNILSITLMHVQALGKLSIMVVNYIGEANMSNSVGLAEVPFTISFASVEPSSSIACSCPTNKVSIFLMLISILYSM